MSSLIQLAIQLEVRYSPQPRGHRCYSVITQMQISSQEQTQGRRRSSISNSSGFEERIRASQSDFYKYLQDSIKIQIFYFYQRNKQRNLKIISVLKCFSYQNAMEPELTITRAILGIKFLREFFKKSICIIKEQVFQLGTLMLYL